MQTEPAESATRSRDGGDVLTVGVGMTVAMWGVGYVTHLPAGLEAGDGAALAAPGWITFSLLAGCVLGGGWLAARFGRRGVRTAAMAGALCGVLNLLVFGGVLKSLADENFLRYAVLWAPGSIIVTALVAAAGGALRRRSAPASDVNWKSAFAFVAVAATLLLLSAGGAVTGAEAGLAVPDWPNSFGYNMFLYPLAKMTGGVFFEHSHRLLGSLVGLTTVLLAFYLWRVETRAWVRNVGFICVALVIVQGLLGGLRVTGKLTTSADAAELRPSLTLAMVHGALGQLFFASLVVLTVLTSRAWDSPPVTLPRASVQRDRAIGGVTLVVVFLQLIFGVLLRHAGSTVIWALHLHLTFAFLVAIAVGLFGIRVWGRDAAAPVARRTAVVLLWLLGLQLLLGFCALAGVLINTGDPHWAQVLITTMHQTVGALVLAATVALYVRHWRLIRPAAGVPVSAPPAVAQQQ